MGKMQTGWQLESCSKPAKTLTESLPLHNNHCDVHTCEAYIDTTIPCSNDTLVPAPAVADNDNMNPVSAPLSPTVACHN